MKALQCVWQTFYSFPYVVFHHHKFRKIMWCVSFPFEQNVNKVSARTHLCWLECAYILYHMMINRSFSILTFVFPTQIYTSLSLAHITLQESILRSFKTSVSQWFPWEWFIAPYGTLCSILKIKVQWNVEQWHRFPLLLTAVFEWNVEKCGIIQPHKYLIAVKAELSWW